MSDVFISYVAEDGAVAADVAAGLEAAQITAWYYERDSVAGVYYTRQVMRVLERANVVVVIISASTLDSSQVDKEIIWSHEARKAFAPLLLDLSYEEFRRQRPDWAMMLGASVALQVPPDGAGALMPRLVRGVTQLLAASGSLARLPARDSDDSAPGTATAGAHAADIPRDGSALGETKTGVRPVSHASAASSVGATSRERESPLHAPGSRGWSRGRTNSLPSGRMMTIGTVLLVLLVVTVSWLRPWSDSGHGSNSGGEDTPTSTTSTAQAAVPGEAEPPRPGASDTRGDSARTGEMPGPLPAAQGGLRVLWQVPATSLNAHGRPLDPVIANDTVLVGNGGALLAIRAATGSSVWPGALVAPDLPPGISPPLAVSAVGDGIAYLGSDALYAVDLEKRITLWRQVVGERPASSAADAINSIVAANGFIFASNESGVFAFEAKEGIFQWRTNIRAEHELAVANGMVYVSWSGGISALDAGTGGWVWNREDLGRTNTPPTVADGSVFLGTDGGIVSLDSGTGADRWVYSTAGPVVNALLVANGLVHAYAATPDPDPPPGDGGRLYAVDVSGAEAWQRTFGRLEAWSWSIVGSTLLLVTGRTLLVLDGERGGSELWRFSPDAVSVSGTLFRVLAVRMSFPSTPVVVNGVIYVVIGGLLYAIGNSNGEDRPPEVQQPG